MLIFGGILGGLFSNKALLIFHHSSKNIKMMFIVYRPHLNFAKPIFKLPWIETLSPIGYSHIPYKLKNRDNNHT